MRFGMSCPWLTASPGELCFSLFLHHPLLSAFLSPAGIYAAQVCVEAASTPLSRCTPPDTTRAGCGSLPCSRQQPPFREPPPHLHPEQPLSPGTAPFVGIYLAVFEAPFKSKPDKDLFSLNMTGCWPRGYFSNKPGGLWPQISLALTGAAGDVEPFQRDHRACELTCF